jgi:rifampicin phosphotransferase
VVNVESDSVQDKRRIGGKAGSLTELVEKGFRVPRWAIVGTEVFERLISGVAAEIAALLDDLDDENVDATHDSIAVILSRVEIDSAAESAISLAYRQVGGGRVAVRSSGVEEDGERLSFAGQFTTRLNVTGADAVLAAVRECWESAFSVRSLAYRLRHGMAAAVPGMAVVVQEMIDADVSGVLFTANPLSGDRTECVVSAVYGLGESLVSGAVDADTVVLDKATGAVRETVVGDKSERLDPGDDGCVVTAVDEARRAGLALEPDRLAELRDIAVLVEEAFGAPRDVEWALADGRLWLLQSRPITSALAPAAVPPAVPPEDGERRVWDNSNIIESFSGVTSPLTYTFAADAYATVYRHYARALRVPETQLRQMDDWLPTMLGYFHGRVYYNLLHWYRMVRIAPVYPLTRRVLEVSLGVEEPLPDEWADRLYPYTFRSGLRRRLSRTVTVAEFVRRFLFMDRSVARFTRRFYAAYREFDDVDYDRLGGDELRRRFRLLERDLLAEWGPMMTLDAALLLSFGTLYLLTRRWLPDAPEWFQWAVANPGDDIESAEPAHALRRLADAVRADPVAHAIVTGTPPERTRQALLDAGLADLVASTDAYVADYGYRSPDELKLEVPDLREVPHTLFAMVREALPAPDAPRQDAAQAYLDEHLRGPKRWVYERVRRKTRNLLADRERLRFCRTRAFGTAKRILRAMGRDLAAMGALADWRDVFLLRLEELLGAFEGTVAHAELPELVALRTRLRAADEKLRAPSRFTTTGTPYWYGNLAGWTADSGDRAGLREFRGTPSCPGVVEGRAVVAADAAPPGAVDGGVLVAYRTDPGWVPALASAAGLVIERGSPLTHVAIVARELGIPTVVQVKDVTRELRTGMLLRIDGSTGSITVLDGTGDTVLSAAAAP